MELFDLVLNDCQMNKIHLCILTNLKSEFILGKKFRKISVCICARVHLSLQLFVAN